MVFGDRRKLIELERIVHPVMVRRIQSELDAIQSHAVINAAILFHMGLHKLCNTVICVKSLLVIQILRGLKRDGLSFLRILRRILAQKRICPKSVGSSVDIYYVWNVGGKRCVERKVVRFLGKLD